MKKNEFLGEHILSEELQEIVSTPPSFLLRWGISIMVIIVVLVLGLSFFIRYSNRLILNMRFVAADSVKIVVSKNDGVIDKLLVDDGTVLLKDEPIVYLETSADHDQIIKLVDQLKKIPLDYNELCKLESVHPPENFKLGELYVSYKNFYNSYVSYRNNYNLRVFEKRKSTLEKRLNFIKQQNDDFFGIINNKLFEMESDKFAMSKICRGVYSTAFARRYVLLTNRPQYLLLLKRDFISNQVAIDSLQQEIKVVKKQIEKETNSFLFGLNYFLREADSWKKKYIISSPVKGKLFYGGFTQRRYFYSGEELFHLKPIASNSEVTEFYGEINIPQRDISNVFLGQNVFANFKTSHKSDLISFRGKITYISKTPDTDGLYFSRVALDINKEDLSDLIKSTYVEAEIVNDDHSIFYRIWKVITRPSYRGA